MSERIFWNVTQIHHEVIYTLFLVSEAWFFLILLGGFSRFSKDFLAWKASSRLKDVQIMFPVKTADMFADDNVEATSWVHL